MRRFLPPRLLDGPPPSLARPLDLLSERWWGLPPRARLLVGALVTALLLVLLTAEVGRAPHGPDVEVLVAARDLPAGHTLGPEDLTRRRWPRDLAPDGAGTDPAGDGAARAGTLTAPVAAGMPVTPAMVADGGVAALVADDAAAVALPPDLLTEEALGARVDLVAPGRDGTPRVLTRGARVLRFDEVHVWVEVVAADAAAVASASTGQGLVAVLHPP